MNYKQRLSSFDAPNQIPASIDSLDLSHAIDSYRPGYQYDLDDIPGLPIFKANGKFKRFVSKPKVVIDKKRISSMPLLRFKSNKELPTIPVRCVTNYNRFSMPMLEEVSETGSRTDNEFSSSFDSLEVSVGYMTPPSSANVSANVSADTSTSANSPDRSPKSVVTDTVTAKHSNENLHDAFYSVNNKPPVSATESRPKQYIVDDDDIDSLFSSTKSKSSHTSNVTDYSVQEDAKSILDIVRFYEDDSDTSSVYTSSGLSSISDNYIEEEEVDAHDDMISVKDSLFSGSSVYESERFGNSVVSLGRGFNNSNDSFKTRQGNNLLSLNKSMPSGSTLSLNKELPKITDSESSLSSKDLPTPPIQLKKCRSPKKEEKISQPKNLQPPQPTQSTQPQAFKYKFHRHTNSVPISIPDTTISEPVIPTKKKVCERPQSMVSTSNISSASFMTTNSLNEAKNEIKQIVRQRPYSYCLDSAKDYNISRYAAPPKTKVVSNPYRSASQPLQMKTPPSQVTPTFQSTSTFQPSPSVQSIPVTPQAPKRTESQPLQLTAGSSQNQLRTPSPSPTDTKFQLGSPLRESFHKPEVKKTLPPTPPKESYTHLATPKRAVTQPIQSTPSSQLTPPTSPKELKMKTSIASFLVKEKETQRILTQNNNTRDNRFSRTYYKY